MALEEAKANRLPTLFIPHGGGPCFFMKWSMGPPDTWDRMAAWLRSLKGRYAGAKAILVVSAHWEEPVVTVQTNEHPPLFFDYYGFPPHTYELKWPAPGSPTLARRVQDLLASASIESREDRERGFDHGVFIPLKVAFPTPSLPTIQLSLHASLDAAAHLAIGRALSPLRDEGVLIVGSGMSFHNMQAMMNPGSSLEQSCTFDTWLEHACTASSTTRSAQLARWTDAPSARFCHPREEHLLPLMVAAGAAENETGRKVFEDVVMGAKVSAFEFGGPAPLTGEADLVA